MLCAKCSAVIPDGSTHCPECGAQFETHVGSFAGSVHWEDQVKPAKSEKEKRRTIIIGTIVVLLVAVFWLLHQTGLLGQIMMELRWLLFRLRYL